MDDKPYAEYVFPLRPREIAEPLDGRDRWFLKFADMQPEEVAKTLRHEWDGIRSPALISFRNALFSFKPVSLVHCDEGARGCCESGWWMKLEGPPNHNEWETEVFLHAPPDPSALDDSFGCRDHPERDVLLEFCTYFYTMQNSMVGSSTGFYGPPWLKLGDMDYYQNFADPKHIDPRRIWEQSIFFYCTDTGEFVLLHPDGRVGWLVSPEQRIQPMARSFSAFLEQCAFCYRIHGLLNYYGTWMESPYATYVEEAT
jgi:hypothetical protein